MKHYFLLFISVTCLFAFSCGNKSQNESVRNQKAIKSEQYKSLKVVEYAYKFGIPDELSAVTLLTADFDKDGHVTKEVHPKMILTFDYKDLNKKKRLTDVKELNSDFLLQYQTNIEYGENGQVTTSRYTVEGNLVWKQVAHHDQYDRDTTNITYDAKGGISQKKAANYDEFGLKQLIEYGAKDEIVSKTVRLTSDKQKRDYLIYNEKGIVASVYTLYYNEENLPIETIHNAHASEGFLHIKYTYAGDLLEKETYFMRNGEPQRVKKYFYAK